MKRTALQSLIRCARKAYQSSPPAAREPAPVGFAARVAARSNAVLARPRGSDLFERLARWGVAVSAAVCLITFIERKSLPEQGAFDVFLETESPIPPK